MNNENTATASKNGATTTVEKTRIQLLKEQADKLKKEIAAENKIISENRAKAKERTHVMILLGSICEKHGQDYVSKALHSANWLKVEDRDAIEYYFDLKARPGTEKKAAG